MLGSRVRASDDPPFNKLKTFNFKVEYIFLNISALWLGKRFEGIFSIKSEHHYYAVCPGGEGAVLKTVGLKGLAGSNPVHGAINFRGDTMKSLQENLIKCIENYQLEELYNKRLFINKYDLDLKYSYELDKYWKEICFDILRAIVCSKNSEIMLEKEFFKHYNNKETLTSLIKNFKINIDMRDYIELEDYITLEEWLKDSANDVLIYKDKTFLYHNTGA